MQIQSLSKLLASNVYPGRGIVVGESQDGQNAVFIYFIMGRSVNSRNRIFAKTEDGIRTEAFDASKMVDPSLIIYAPVRVLGKHTIVTNGDQTDTIRDFLNEGSDFIAALRTREFEPDAPNFTPRVSAMATFEKESFTYQMALLASDSQREESCVRYFYEYQPFAGEGRFLHTYMGDGSPIPSFEGEPERVTLEGDIEQLTQTVWDNLNEENKVSLYVRFTNLASGESEERIVNKNH